MSKTRKIFATLTMVAMATIVSLTAVSSAQASHKRHHRAGDVALGVLGGLIISGAIANSRREAFPAQPVRRRPARGSHFDWCERRYRSYDARSDTFIGYDRREHYCISPYSR